jgi:hypothetical protein
MSTILSLPEELVIEILLKGDHMMLLACQRVRDRLCLSIEFLCNPKTTAGLPHVQHHNQGFSLSTVHNFAGRLRHGG